MATEATFETSKVTTTYTLSTGARGPKGDTGPEVELGADENYVTDAEKTKISNLSGTNTGDETAARISALSWSGYEATMRGKINAYTGGPLRVACVGESLVVMGSAIVSTSTHKPYMIHNGGSFVGWIPWLAEGKAELVRRNSVFGVETDLTYGNNGFQVTNITDGLTGVYLLDDAIASDAEVLVLEGGVNDVQAGVSAETLITRFTNYWTKAKASGKIIVALNVFPSRTSGGVTVTTAHRDVWEAVNTALPAIANSLGIHLIDANSLFAKDNDRFSTAASTWDALHTTPSSALRIAKAIDAVLAPYYAQRTPRLILPSGKVSGSPWITPSNSPSQATIPTGWGTSGTLTNTYSAVTDADGTTWQRVNTTNTNGTPNYDTQGIYVLQTTMTGLAGKKVRAGIRIRVRADSLNAKNFNFYAYTWEGSAKTTKALDQVGNWGQPTGTVDGLPAFEGVFITPPFVIDATATQIRAQIEFLSNYASYDIRQFGIFEELER